MYARKLNIILSSRELIWGGGEVFLSSLAITLENMGHVIYLRVDKESQIAKRNQHFKVIDRLTPHPSDLVVANDFRSLWQSILVDRGSKRAFVVHGEWQWSPIRARIANIFKPSIHAVSSFVADYGRSVGVKLPQKILPLGPETILDVTKSFHPIDTSKQLRVGTIARLDPIKRLGLFKDIVMEGDWWGKIICPTPSNDIELIEYQAVLNCWNIELKESNTAIGEIEDCDIFVSTSISESLGLSHLEALQQGKPIFSTALHGPPDYLLGALSNSMLVDGSPVQLVEQILKGIDIYNSDIPAYMHQARVQLAKRGPLKCAEQILGIEK